MILHLDFETRSELGFKGFKQRDGYTNTGVGVTLYAKHPSTEVLCTGYAIDEEKPDCLDGRWSHLKRCLKDLIEDADYVCAHNASFEWNELTYTLGIEASPSKFICTAAMARHAGLPGSLKEAAEVLGLRRQKITDSPMMKMCKPRSLWVTKGKGPKWFFNEADFEKLCEYCMQDVEVERALYHALPPLPNRERRIWLMDFAINQRGIPVDVSLAKVCMDLGKRITDEASEDLSVLTEGHVTTIKQRDKYLEWCKEKGTVLSGLSANEVTETLARGDLESSVRQALELRQTAGGAAWSKYQAFIDKQDNGRIKNGYIYCGSHTRRWAATGVQSQNIIKPPMKREEAEAVIESLLALGGVPDDVDTKKVLDSLVRSVICAPPGKVFVAFDLAGIEARVVNWLACQDDVVKDFADGVGVYEKMAGTIYKCDPASIKNPSKERDIGKQTELGCGFGMQDETLAANCRKRGIEVSGELARKAVNAYALRHPKVVELWWKMHHAAKETLLTGKDHRVLGCRGTLLFSVVETGNIKSLALEIPSGGMLYYPKAKMESGNIVFWGKTRTGKYDWVRLYHGVEIENAVQSLARDLFAEAMLRMEDASYGEIVMHSHDEIVVEVDEWYAEEHAEALKHALTSGTLWSKGLPVAVTGWIGKRYRK